MAVMVVILAFAGFENFYPKGKQRRAASTNAGPKGAMASLCFVWVRTLETFWKMMFAYPTDFKCAFLFMRQL